MEKQEKGILEEEVGRAIKRLNEKEAFVIKHRVMSDSPLTLQEIGIN